MAHNTVYFYHEKGRFGEFSNFFPSLVVYKEKIYPTSEHAFQAMKFVDYPEYQEAIRTANTPGIAKILACQRTGGGYKWRTDMNSIILSYRKQGVKLRSDWEEVKVEIMYEILVEKFSTNPKLKNVLLSTGDSMLVEHTTRDNFWGDGGDGSGQNMLGKTLVRVRDNFISNIK